jgi:AmmeMemoRadiSam system protein B
VRARVRSPAVAGTFYPSDPNELRAKVAAALAAASRAAGDAAPTGAPPKALVVPHAGYVYSGEIAASGYVRLAAAAGSIERVVLLGPAHRVPVRGLAVSSADAFETPLGRVRVDTEARDRLAGLRQVVVDDVAHAGEHSLEVHLPFIQVVLGDVAVLPLAVGAAGPEDVAEVLDALWGGPETAVVVSTDLSHYLDYESARAVDRVTAEAIVSRRYDKIAVESACGAHPLRGLLLTAERRGLDVALLDLRSSGDTAGPRDRVVGYGAFAVA